MRFLKNKKGNVLDWLLISLIIFIASITFIVSYFVIDNINSSGLFSNYTTAQAAIDNGKTALLSFDNMMIFILIGLSVFVLISSAIVMNHPAIFFTSIFLLFVAIMISATLSNTFWIFKTGNEISSTALLFPKVSFIMENIPLYLLFMGLAAVIVGYVSYQRQT